LTVQLDVLNEDEVREARQCLAAGLFQDGNVTAGAAAKQVKNNDQARGDDPAIIALARRIRLALEAHAIVRSAVRPVRWSRLLFSRYGPGQQYGAHIDNALVYDGSGWPVRTDMSFTLFLSDPESYEGGALLIHDQCGDREFRPRAGSAVFYPTGQIHSVTPVTGGLRLACIGWVQSAIRRTDQRELLADLEKVRKGEIPSETPLLLDKTIGNLLRMWGEE
jgi:PKHD-type hydroxylase